MPQVCARASQKKSLRSRCFPSEIKIEISNLGHDPTKGHDPRKDTIL